MKNRRTNLSSVIALILLSAIHCAQGQIPKAKKISEYKQTDFLPTLEHKLARSRNSIYCASFLYAWNEIRNIIKGAFEIDSSQYDLVLVNNSTSYVNALRSREYVSNGTVDGNLIKITSEFIKSLPFETPLVGDGRIKFDNKSVPSFGSYGGESRIIEILYYRNDGEFVIKLSPKDVAHEIVLYMPRASYTTMADIVSDIAAKKKLGLVEKARDSTIWKYSVTAYDIVDIPKIDFNIEANFPAIEGNILKANAMIYRIGIAKQRTGFYLNETGAEVDTDALGYVVFAEPALGGRPKRMIFDKAFFVMLKRVDSETPYFGLWVVNTELMTKG